MLMTHSETRADLYENYFILVLFPDNFDKYFPYVILKKSI